MDQKVFKGHLEEKREGMDVFVITDHADLKVEACSFCIYSFNLSLSPGSRRTSRIDQG